MRVLAELDLARFQRSSGTVSCTIMKGKRVELERSETFRACSSAGEEGLRYLSRPDTESTKREGRLDGNGDVRATRRA